MKVKDVSSLLPWAVRYMYNKVHMCAWLYMNMISKYNADPPKFPSE
jgi:hypothetical protein